MLAIVAAAAASAGAFGTFTSSTADSQNVASGTVVIALGAHAAETNRFDIDATDIAPGDTIQRSVDLNNTGSIDLASVKLTTTATTSSLLDTDTTNGLQMVIDSCSVAWTESAGQPYTYTCGGTTQSVLATGPVIGATQTLSNLNALTHGDSDFLRVKLSFPSTADDTFQNQTSVIHYVFDAVQRTGTDK